MKASVERLRWGLAAAAVLLLLVLAGFLGYGRYKQVKKWRETLRRLNLHGPHETTGFTYSSSPKDRTSYKVRAARVVQHGDGKWSMYDAAVTLYSKTSSDEDHIYGKDIEYDQNTGVATAIGEVHMDLQIPGSSTNSKTQSPAGPASDTEDDKHIIHVKTSGLVYVHKLDVAATDQPVEFRYAGMQCTSKGAEFDSGEGLLHLLADVVMTGTVKNAPLIVHAAKADLNRQDNTITLLHPVAQSQGRTATADNALAHLRKDGSVEQAEASGGVVFDAGTRHVTAAAYSGTFSSTSLPVTAKLTGNVLITDSAVAKPMRGQANEVNATFDAAGAPASVVATGAAHVLLTEHKPGIPDLPREMRGDRIAATFVPIAPTSRGRKAQSRISEVHAVGSAMARGASIATANDRNAAGLKSTQVSADDLRAVFDADAAQKPEVRQVFGSGHTRLQQDAPLGEKQTSSGDTLQIDFTKANATSQTEDQNAMQIASATQSGHVVIHNIPATKPGAATPEAPSDATAARAVYDGAASRLTLTGGTHFSQGQTAMTAATVAVNQRTGDAEASGDVLATLTNTAPAKNSATQNPTEPQITHVAADRATLLHVSQLNEFYGTDAHPARLWQGASQVQAATLLFDQKKKSLSARPALPVGMVHAVFANASQSEPHKPATKDENRVVRVTSAAMDYDDIHREALFRGNVRVDGTTAQAQSQSATVFLSPAQPGTTSKADSANPFGGSLRRIVLSESVRIAQPGRTGTGDQLVYTAVDGTYVLTGTPGKPPHIVDAQQGSVTGATLLFHGEDSTIVVDGATAPNKPGRVRTETEVRGK